MSRLYYSNVEHVIVSNKILEPSLVTRDIRFTLKERVFFSLKKTIFLSFFANLL